MIKSIHHKGLKLYWIQGDKSKLPAEMMGKIERVLHIIHYLEDVPGDLAGFNYLKPHPLKGSNKGYWAFQIIGNWRIIFKFNYEKGDAYEVDFVD